MAIPAPGDGSPDRNPLPLRLGNEGAAVRDLQQRLVRSGEAPLSDPSGIFGAATDQAVRAFQARRGLHADGVCGPQTWAALVEAGYELGDRPLYLRAPMLRGDDVASLQQQLSALGFDAGRLDGIFGPDTAEALADYQANIGLASDGIFGPEVHRTLERLGDRTHTMSKAGVRERLELLSVPRHLVGRRVLVAESGALPALANALCRALEDAGAHTVLVHHPDGSAQAAEANSFAAELLVALTLVDRADSSVAYYGSPSFTSAGGQQLSGIVAEHLRRIGLPGTVECEPMRLPVLRETRMPAVSCELGPPSWVVEHGAECSSALAAAIGAWVLHPVQSPTFD